MILWQSVPAGVNPLQGQENRKGDREEMNLNFLWEEDFTGEWEKQFKKADECSEYRQGDSGLHVAFSNGKAVITAENRVLYFRGLSFVKQWIDRGESAGEIKEEKRFSALTYMLDCSRNAVAHMAYCKRLLFQLALMGYDRLMLYTEDTYEIGNRPFFGWMRGRFSQKEIRELDDFAQQLGIELVPCIQTLAHLNAIFHWKVFQKIHDTGDIISSGEEETYELIEDMIRTWADTVRSRVMNIGLDEAEMIGRGSYLNRYGYEDRFEIMTRHLKRVLDICEKYGFTCMMWSDMFFKLLSGEGYHSANVVINEEVLKKIPKNVELVYWDYYSRDEATYERMIENHFKMETGVGFAGGAWKWNGFGPLMEHSVQISRLALRACTKYGLQNIIVTGWGDDGGEAAQSTVLPVLVLYAEACYGNETDTSRLSERMLCCTGGCFEDFMKLDLVNLTPDNPSPGRVSVGPAKYLLYQDALLGIYDRHVDPVTYPAHFKKTAEEFRAIAKKGGAYAYLFETLEALCVVLASKAALGIEIREAYLKQDQEKLAKLAECARQTAAQSAVFKEKLRTQWYLENKSFGFEVQDIRLAGVEARLKSAAARIEDYLEGRVLRLEELEEVRLLLDERENPGYRTLPLSDNQWSKMVTAGII